MKFRSAYGTMACHGFNMQKTIDALKAALASGGLTKVEGRPVYVVQGNSTWTENVPAFAHPIVMTGNVRVGNDEEEIVVVDVRAFGRWDEIKYAFVVRNDIEYALQLHRGTLNDIWVNENATILRDVGNGIPMAVFASWISEALGRRFALDPRQQLDLAIFSAIYYNSLFRDEPTQHEDDKMRSVNAIARNLRASTTDVMEVMDKVGPIGGVKEFCAMMEEITGSVRLKEVNAGLLYAIVGGTWFGTNAKEMVAVALEHPPTWMAILLAAYSERTFKNSAIAKITERTGGKDGGKQYMQSILALMDAFSTGK